jgi:endoglucanase
MTGNARLRRLTFPLTLAAAAAIGTAGAGCTPFGMRPVSDQPVTLKECGPDGVIDDLEDNNNQISVIAERGGYWYTYADKEGSTIWPVQGDQGGTFTPVPGGANNSKFAVQMKGKLAGASIVYAAMGLNFLDPKEPFNASKFEGITFFAKRSPSSTSKLIVKIPDGNTDPDGQVCSDCFNDFGATINVGTEWQRYTLPFRDLKQEPHWGAPRKPHLNPSKVYAIHWEAKSSGSEFDFIVDDIAFVCR